MLQIVLHGVGKRCNASIIFDSGLCNIRIMLAQTGDDFIKGGNAASLLHNFLGMLSFELLQQLQVALQLKIFKFHTGFSLL